MSKKLKIKIDKEFEKMSILGYDATPLGGYAIDDTYISNTIDGYTTDYLYRCNTTGGYAIDEIYEDNTTGGSIGMSAYMMEQLNNLRNRIQALEVAQANDLHKISNLESKIIELEKAIENKVWEALYK